MLKFTLKFTREVLLHVSMHCAEYDLKVFLCTVHYTHTHTHTHTHTNKDWINMQPLDQTDSVNDVF